MYVYSVREAKSMWSGLLNSVIEIMKCEHTVHTLSDPHHCSLLHSISTQTAQIRWTTLCLYNMRACGWQRMRRSRLLV